MTGRAPCPRTARTRAWRRSRSRAFVSQEGGGDSLRPAVPFPPPRVEDADGTVLGSNQLTANGEAASKVVLIINDSSTPAHAAPNYWQAPAPRQHRDARPAIEESRGG